MFFYGVERDRLQNNAVNGDRTPEARNRFKTLNANDNQAYVEEIRLAA